MGRTLIPKTNYHTSILSPLWVANPQGIVLVTSTNAEYYVSGIYFAPQDKTAYAIEHYVQGQLGVIDNENKGPVMIEADDSLFLET